jgi:hypothetical protein
MKKYLDFILVKIEELINKYGEEYVGNNFNSFFNTDEIDNIIQNKDLFDKNGSPRNIKSKLDVFRGKIFENILKILINSHFEKDTSYNHIKCVSSLNEINKKEIKDIVKSIKIKRKNKDCYKNIDRDIIVYSEKIKDRIFFISVKGTARERIGQFLSHLFIFDEKVLKIKYNDLYFLDNIVDNKKINFKYAFVSFDLAKKGDFSALNSSSLNYKSTKQLEIYLIDDDENVSAGIYVLNNLPKLNKVGNFSSLLAKIKNFFDQK